MTCLHCGYCCTHYAVIIVDDPEKGISNDNLIFHEGKNEKCKHLQGDEIGKYECAVHDREWYPETPCFSHDQIGGTVCRIGEYMLKNYKGKKINKMFDIPF